MSRPTLLERLTAGYVVNDDGCWIWQRFVNKHGYGRMTIRPRNMPAHRVAYELLVGPIPDGLHIDHTCHNDDPTCPGGVTCVHRRCVNPAHLEAVTQQENNRRAGAAKTHCKHGHEYTPENTLCNHPTKGWRRCRVCLHLARKRSVS